MSVPCFVPADILLPAANISLDPWACIAVDQFTSQPEYWQRAEELAAGKPSTLHIVLPEAYLGTPQEEERMQTIRRTMQEYRKSVLTRRVHGFVYGRGKAKSGDNRVSYAVFSREKLLLDQAKEIGTVCL